MIFAFPLVDLARSCMSFPRPTVLYLLNRDALGYPGPYSRAWGAVWNQSRHEKLVHPKSVLSNRHVSQCDEEG